MTTASVQTGPEAGPGAWTALSRAAAHAFDAPSPTEIRRELLVVEVADGAYAVPIERVREIVRLATITRVPPASRSRPANTPSASSQAASGRLGRA